MKRRLSNQRTGGLTLVEVLVAIAAVVVLAGILLPMLANSKARSNRIGCVSNLKGIGLAFRMFSGDHGEKFPWAVSITNDGTLEFSRTADVFRHFLAISNELSSPKVLHCEKDTKRTKTSSWDQLTNNTHLSYFVGLDSSESTPQTILSGDRNLTTNGRAARGVISIATNVVLGFTREMHQTGANIALGDGSAQQVTAGAFQKQHTAQILGGSREPVRLAIP